MTSIPLTVTTWVVILGYFILVGGAPGTEFNGWARALNAAIALTLIVRWIRAEPTEHDAVDRGLLLGLLGFLTACVLSQFPRQSFDAALQATALVAGFHFARRAMGREVRASIETAMGWLCVGLGVLFCLTWGRGWLSWLLLSGGLSPPLSLPLPTGPFGHRHDVALLLVLLSPALWSPSFRKRRVVAIVGSGCVAAIVLIDSSRNVEVALLAATAVVVAANRLRMTVASLRLAAAVTITGVVVAITLLLMSPALMSRMANITSVLARFTLWGEAGEVWVAHPFVGIGPGGFPFSYMMTDHFRLSLFDPRHPDNAVVQLLVEAGLLGLGAAMVCLVTLVRASRSRFQQEPRAAWAILFFAFATLGANPSDFIFLMIPAVVWAAILTPVGRGETRPLVPRWAGALSDRLPAVRTIALVLIGVAVVLTSAAGIAYEVARNQYIRGNDRGAEEALAISAALDPSLAIYRREQASLALARGDVALAIDRYRQSLALSRLDPVAWRGLALALLQSDDVDRAAEAAERALDLVFLAPENQLVRAATAQSDPAAFGGAMRVLLQTAPWYGVIGWDGTVVGFADRAHAARMAVDSAPSVQSGEGYLGAELLALMADRPDIARAIADKAGPFLKGSAAALAALAECNPEESLRVLEYAGRAEIEAPGFWIVRPLVLAAAVGDEHERNRAAALSLRFLGLSGARGPLTATALAGNISDAMRYRRISLGVTTAAAALPSGHAAMWTLLTDPADATMQFGSTWPPGC